MSDQDIMIGLDSILLAPRIVNGECSPRSVRIATEVSRRLREKYPCGSMVSFRSLQYIRKEVEEDTDRLLGQRSK